MFMEPHITKQGLEKLKQELHELKTVKRKEMAQRLKHAISFGDLSENAAYSEAKDAQAFLEGRIAELEQTVKDAVIITAGSSRDTVGVGSIVTLKNKQSGEEEVFTITGSAEADPLQGKISNDSPLGKTLLGHKKGDTITFELPDGKTDYTILKIA